MKQAQPSILDTFESNTNQVTFFKLIKQDEAF